MRTDGHDAIHESLASKSFRSSSTNREQSRTEISGFGDLVPGGAQKPPTEHLRTTFAAARVSVRPRRSRPRPPWSSPPSNRSHRSDRYLIVTVRHITSFRIVAIFSDSPPCQALNCHRPQMLEA